MSADVLKKLTYALGIVVVLWVGSEFLRADPSDGVTVWEAPEFSAEDVDSILITRADGVYQLARRDTSWTVDGFDAATGAVRDLLGAVAEEMRLQLVARNPDSHGRFDLTDDAARRVQVFAGGEEFDLLVGKRGRDFQSVFVRRPGEDDVYSARSRLATFMDRRLEDWRDKIITAIIPDSIAHIEITRGSDTYTVERGENDAWMVGDVPARGADVNRLLEQFRALTASGFATEAQADSADFERPERRVLLRDRAEVLAAELAFDSTATNYWVRAAGNQTIYRLDRFKVDQLTPADSTLREAVN